MSETKAAEAPTAPAMPPTLGGVIPYLTVEGALEASGFYQKAFGAQQVFAYPPDDQGRTMHVHLYLNGSSVMLSDAYPEHGHPFETPQGFTVQLIVDDVDAWWARALAAGAEVVTPVQEMFWGDRWGQVRDPFGISWSMSTPAKR